jgi:PAS domain S-box-containing protein
MKKNHLNLRGKLLLVVVIGLLISFSVIGTFRIIQEKKIRAVEIDHAGQDRVTLIADSLSSLIVAFDYGNIEILAERIVQMEDVEQITIVNRSGKMIATRNSSDFDPEKKGLVFGAPVIFSGETIGRVEILVSLDRLESSIRTTYKNVIVALSISAIFLGVLIYASVSVLVVGPVLRLGKAADQLALGDFLAVLPAASRDELGNLVRAFSSMRESRKLNEARLQAIFDNSPDAFIQLDNDGNIIGWNDKAETIWGYGKDEVSGRNFSMAMPPQELGLNEGYRKCYQKSENIIGVIREVVGQRKDGSHFPLELRTSEIPFDEGSAFLVSARDITERRENETKLLNAMNAAEAANAAKSAFLSNMSHEIRTPMNSIIGMTKLAIKTHLNAKQHDYLSKIEYSANHLLSLINDILDFSKIEANKLEIEMLDFDLGAVFDSLSNQLTHTAASKGLRLKMELDPKLSLPLRGDSLRLSQVLLNYASNAIKFTEKGEIRIVGKLFEEGADDLLVRFEVRDSGIGLSRDDIDKLFQPFHQADASTTRKYGGTGLGLAICKQLVELMGGTVGVDSEPGKGSVFWFVVRLLKGEALHMQKQAPTLDLAVLKQASILLVEDNLFNQQVAVEILAEVGANVTIANNGQEAIDTLLKQQFDCVLMDVQMPVMDGLEATRKIRTIPELAGTHIIAMTANARSEDKASCFAAGMNNFISKPVYAEQLYAILAQCMVTRGKIAGEVLHKEIEPASVYPSVVVSSVKAGSRESDDPVLIDLTALGKMLGSDPAKIHKFALKFVQSAQQGLQEIEEALAREDMVALGALGHRNKSPARTVGAFRYADMCQSLEQFRNGGDIQEARRIVARMRPLLQQIAAHIDSKSA